MLNLECWMRLKSSRIPPVSTVPHRDDDVEFHVLGCRVDILGTNCDQCVCMVQCCFTSTETVRLFRTGSPRRPSRLSHSSWALRSYSSVLLYVHRNHQVYCGQGEPGTATSTFTQLLNSDPTRWLARKFVRKEAGLWDQRVTLYFTSHHSTTQTPSTGLRQPSFNHCRI